MRYHSAVREKHLDSLNTLAKHRRHHKAKKRHKFQQVVLQWCPCEEKAPLGLSKKEKRERDVNV